MKKAFLIIVFVVSILQSYSQKSSINVDFGHRFDVERMGKWGFGAEYQYRILDNFRLAPGAMVYFGDNVTSLDINANLHYLIFVNKITLYPLIGLAMANNHFNADGGNISTTDWGLNLGAGGEYNILKTSYINIQYNYSLLHKDKQNWYKDYSLIRIGYGFRF